MVISLSAITSLLSLSAALVATWVMQVTRHQAGLDSSIARMALAQRIALAALAIFLMLNAVTPFIIPDPPWLSAVPVDGGDSYQVARDIMSADMALGMTLADPSFEGSDYFDVIMRVGRPMGRMTRFRRAK